MADFGFGDAPWGAFGWGDGAPSFELLTALAVRENVVRLTFSSPPLFSNLGDPSDASLMKFYRVRLEEGSPDGMDGKPARQVFEAVVKPGPSPFELDLYVDRDFSAYPSRYVVTLGEIAAGDGTYLEPTVATFLGVKRALVPNVPSLATPRKDIASPNDLQALLSSDVDAASVLGVFAYDETGDYAADAGATSYRKRVFRRIFTALDGFAHLPGYGLGILDMVKMLFRTRTQQDFAGKAQDQILEEPETLEAFVGFEQDSLEPGIVRMIVRARSKTGETVNETVPIAIGGGS